jgi:tetratricopeptide (TPR) repeat protein
MQISYLKKTQFLKNTFYTLAIIIVGIIIYFNSFQVPFVFDDINYIGVNDPNVHMTSLSWDQLKKAISESRPRNRPLANISFALNYYFNSSKVFGYHLVNLVIHLITGICLFIFIKLTLKVDAYYPRTNIFRTKKSLTVSSSFIAFSSVLIWTVHPVQSQAVTYIVQRMTSMAAMFYVLGMVFYIKGRTLQISKKKKTSVMYLMCSFIATLCAIASKQNAAMLPFFMLLYEWFFFQNLKVDRLKPFLWLIILILLFSSISFFYLGHNPIDRIMKTYAIRDFNIAERLLTEPRVVIYYLSLIFFPHPLRLNLDHSYPLSDTFFEPITTIISLCSIIALLGIVGYLVIKKERLLSLCILWFLGNLIIESTVIGIEIIFEHRTYLPGMLIYLMVIILLLRLTQKKWTIISLIACTSILLSTWTIHRNDIWQNEIVFWKDCINKSPKNARPYLNLAYALQQKTNYERAITEYKKAISINPKVHIASAYFNMGNAYLKLKKYYEAIDCYYAALKGSPKNIVKIHQELAKTFKVIDELDSAILHYEKILNIDPSNTQAAHKIIALKTSMKKTPDPIMRVKNKLKKDPENLALRFRLGNLYEQNKFYNNAIFIYENILLSMANPYQKLYIITLNQLAKVKAIIGKYDSAINLYKRSVQLVHDNSVVYYNIAVLYSLKNQPHSAGEWLKAAVEAGYKDLDKLKSDQNLANFHNSIYFEQFLSTLPKK